MWCRMTVESFVQLVWTVFEIIRKCPKMAVLIIFGLILVMFRTSQSNGFDAIADSEAPLGVE